MNELIKSQETMKRSEEAKKEKSVADGFRCKILGRKHDGKRGKKVNDAEKALKEREREPNVSK